MGIIRHLTDEELLDGRGTYAKTELEQELFARLESALNEINQLTRELAACMAAKE